MTIKTINGANLALDVSKWMYSRDSIVTILGEISGHYVLETIEGMQFQMHRSLIHDNRLPINENKVDIGSKLLKIYFLDKQAEIANQRFNSLFTEHAEQLFLHPDIILAKAEYYVLHHQILRSGIAPGVNITYCLGILLESILQSDALYFKELDGHKDLYVISVGAMQSGKHYVRFWCADEERLIYYPMGKGVLPCSPASYFISLSKLVANTDSCMVLDKQDKIFEQFLDEIGIKFDA